MSLRLSGRKRARHDAAALYGRAMNLTLEELSLLEHLYDKVGSNTRARINIPQDDEGQPRSDLATRLYDAGVLKFSGMGMISITQSGVNVVSELRQRRNDRPARAAALRLALINWL